MVITQASGSTLAATESTKVDTEFSVELPEPLPTGTITVNNEQHEFVVREDYTGKEFEQTEYTLDKAPVEEIESVTGMTDNGYVTFNEGTDYDLSGDKERIVWDVDNRVPEPGSQFYVTYTAESIMSRFSQAAEQEFQNINIKLDNIIDSKFVSTAQGNELDELGKLFGSIGKRRGRDDEKYRTYLRSIVQSVVSRGTVPNIKKAISAATGIEESEISIDENFTDVEYDIIISPNEPHRSSSITEVAETADPSGVKLNLVRYRLPEEIVGADDDISFTVSEIYTDELAVDDGVAIDANVVTVTTDEMGVTDAATNPSPTTASDSAGLDDAFSVGETYVAWDVGDWNNMNWATEHN